MRHPFDLDGKVAVVTGANAGLGSAIALALAQAGAHIAAVGRSAPGETLAQVRAAGRRGEWIPAHLDDSAGVGAIVAEAVSKFGAIDILVNNAGTIRRNDALDFTEEDWDAVIGVNLKTAFFLSQAAARWWVAAKRGGKIINIASMLSVQGGIRVAS
ncbi:MAG TPA: SDR family NAD(P)-dependent oxidoreductase, partial [Rudaea sp.]